MNHGRLSEQMNNSKLDGRATSANESNYLTCLLERHATCGRTIQQLAGSANDVCPSIKLEQLKLNH